MSATKSCASHAPPAISRFGRLSITRSWDYASRSRCLVDTMGPVSRSHRSGGAGFLKSSFGVVDSHGRGIYRQGSSTTSTGRHSFMVKYIFVDLPGVQSHFAAQCGAKCDLAILSSLDTKFWLFDSYGLYSTCPQGAVMGEKQRRCAETG